VADVELFIGGHAYTLSCADGEEDDLRKLGLIVDGEIARARAMVGGMTEVRQLLFAAIFLADQLTSGSPAERTAASENGTEAPSADMLNRVAERIEAVVRLLSAPGVESGSKAP
jgi:cell division protein ZapA